MMQLNRKSMTLILGAFMCAASCNVNAGNVDPANMTTFSPGAPAVAAEVNGNFDEQTTQINDNSDRITALESAGGNAISGSVYRWAQWSSYEQSAGWFASNDASLFGGIAPSQWTDGNALASQLSSDKNVLRTLFNRKGYAGSNAMVVADEYLMYSSTNARMAGVLFRIRNTTGSTINWNLSSRLTAYGGWNEYASIAINGSLVWQSGGASMYAAGASSVVTTNIPVPPNQTSTVIVIAGSAPGFAISGGIAVRANFLAFHNNSLTLPAGLEYVDDLDTATGGWDQ